MLFGASRKIQTFHYHYFELIKIPKYLLDFDDPVFIKDGSIDHDERDKKYRDEAKDKDEVKGWLPLYHPNGSQCLYKQEDTLPPSLKEAINVFLIVVAITLSFSGCSWYTILSVYLVFGKSQLLKVSINLRHSRYLESFQIPPVQLHSS